MTPWSSSAARTHTTRSGDHTMGEWEDRMHRPVRHLAEQLKGIRAGTISAGFVETFRISWQGRSEPISRLATITHQQGRIVVTPFDRLLVPAIVKALVERGRTPMPSIRVASRSRCPPSAASSGPRSRDTSRDLASRPRWESVPPARRFASNLPPPAGAPSEPFKRPPTRRSRRSISSSRRSWRRWGRENAARAATEAAPCRINSRNVERPIRSEPVKESTIISQYIVK